MSERQECDAKNLCRVKVSPSNVKVQQSDVYLTILVIIGMYNNSVLLLRNNRHS